jgi:hypothetical protein
VNDHASTEPVSEAKQPLIVQCLTIQRGTLGTVADAEIRRTIGTSITTDIEAKTNYGALATASVGNVGTNKKNRKTFLSFDVSAVPAGSVITQATVTLNTTNTGPGDVSVRPASAAWAENLITFANAPAYGAEVTSFLAGPAPAGPRSFSIQGLVSGWVNGAPNNGIVLLEESGTAVISMTLSSSEDASVALRPKLEVCYQIPQPCDQNPCQNGGVCSNGPGNGFTCACPPGFTGPTCALDVNECLNNPCPGTLDCINTPGSFLCTCAAGCDDSSVCTTDSCDPAQGCVHVPVAVDDGSACTTDACNPVTGVSHTPVSIDDNNACTTDACDAVTGVSHTPVSIDDGNACTADACNPATGVSHTPLAIDDGNACTADACNPITGVSHTPVATDDGNACTTDACNPVTGVSHTPVATDDNNACTADACDPATGVSHTPLAINDNNACTADACDPATGVTHTPLVINDNNACTTDACNPVTGVTHTPVATDDGNFCTDDACNPATGVTHTPVNVSDGNACTTDVCNPVTGILHAPIAVDDGNACTVDACDPVTGVSHTALSCDDNTACTVDSCNPVQGCLHDASGCGNLICGTVNEQTNGVVSPSDAASVTIACNFPANVIKGTATAADGTYCVGLNNGELNCATYYVKAAKVGFTSVTKTDPGDFSMVQNGTVFVNYQLNATGFGTCLDSNFEDNFEGNAGWVSSAADDGVQWQRKANNPLLINGAAGVCIALPPDETSFCALASDPACLQAPGAISNAYSGQYAYWFGNSNLGTYNGNFMGSSGLCSGNNGGTSGNASGGSISGTLTSPTFHIPPGTNTLQFRGWFEIESVDPQQFAYDQMLVSVINQAGVETNIGTVNPEVDTNGPAQQPYSSGGYNATPVWNLYTLDISSFGTAPAGQDIKIRFTFNSTDSLYNGYRGWLIDDVVVSGANCPQ